MKEEVNIKRLRFQKIVDEIEDYAILLLDSKGTIENWNKGAEKIKGYTASEIIGRNFRTFFLPSDREAHLPEKLLAEAARFGKTTHEGWRVKKDGKTFWVSVLITAIHNAAGEVIGFTKVVRDLTLKKLTEESLRQSEERYSKMIAEIQDYAIILMDKEGTIENWNKGAEKIKGYTASEIIGQNFRKFYLPEDVANHKPEKLLEIASREGRAQDESWRVRKDGSKFWGSITITALRNDAGEIIGFSKVTRDLTEKMETEKAMLHVQKMEAKNKELEQLSYIVSHDLQEPLRNISGLVEAFTEEYGSHVTEDGANILAYIKDSTSRMSELLNGFLDYGRLGVNSKATKIDSHEIIQEVLADLRTFIQRSGAVIKLEHLPVIFGYRTEFRLLLQNLISNAIKFQKPGVRPEICIWAEKKGPIWKFAVKDNGIGIDPQFRERIFIIFQRLNNREDYAGTGIGLAHCKRIVDLHNGNLWVESEPGQGSTFYFTIDTNSFFNNTAE